MTSLSAGMGVIATTVAALTYSLPASALSFTFSFSNINGGINGTVTGLIDGLSDNAVSAATAITITDAPGALSSLIGTEVISSQTLENNEFQVTNGVITASYFETRFSAGPPIQLVLDLNATSLGLFDDNKATLSAGENPVSCTICVGSVGFPSSNPANAPTFAPAQPVLVPEPSAIIGLSAVVGLGLVSRRKQDRLKQ